MNKKKFIAEHKNLQKIVFKFMVNKEKSKKKKSQAKTARKVLRERKAKKKIHNIKNKDFNSVSTKMRIQEKLIKKLTMIKETVAMC